MGTTGTRGQAAAKRERERLRRVARRTGLNYRSARRVINLGVQKSLSDARARLFELVLGEVEAGTCSLESESVERCLDRLLADASMGNRKTTTGGNDGRAGA